jgi:hypothetical protein
MPRRSPRRWGLAVVIFLWIATAFGVYYAFHRPFPAQFAEQVFVAAGDLIIIAALFALGGALGARLLARLQVTPLARLAARAALGLGVLSLAYLVVGSTLGTESLLAWALLLVLAIWLRNDLALWLADFSDFKTLWKSSGKLGHAIGWLCILIFALTLLKALAPPLEFDTLAYHLSLPKLYLTHGRISYLSEIMYWGFPQLPHMLMTWAGALGAARGALLGWGMGLLATIGLLGHLSARLSPRRGWVAVAALLCGSSLAAALASAYVDWPSILISWGVLFFLDLWAEKKKRYLVMWAGVFAGLAFGTKYTAGLLAPLGLLAILWISKQDWRAAGRFLLAAFALAAPWLLRNAFATGNPFYPLLLPGGAMDTFRLNYYQGFTPQGSSLDAVLLPLRATFVGVEGGRVGDAPGYESSVGPLLLVLGALALLPSDEKKDGRNMKYIAALIAIGGMVVWAAAGRLSGHLIRTQLYYSLFPAFAVLAGFGFAAAERVRLPNLRLGRVLGALVCVSLGLNALQVSLNAVDSGVFQIWSGQINEEAYLEKNLGLYALVMNSLPNQLPANARVLMLWEPRGYACAPGCDPDEIIDRWPHDLMAFGSTDAVLASWRAAGYTQLLYYRLGARFIYEDPEHFHPFDFTLMDGALADLPLIHDYNGDYLLYSLAP